VLRGSDELGVVEPGEHPPTLALVEDGSPVSRVLRAHLGDRARRGRRPRQLVPRPEPKPSSAVPKETPRPSPARPHPLQPFIDVLDHRLVELGLGEHAFVFHNGSLPMFHYDGAVIRVAANHPRLLAVAAAHAARSPWADAAIDAMVAHLVTVLNVALTHITDAAEHHAIFRLLSRR
jgi:hypothetical protein